MGEHGRRVVVAAVLAAGALGAAGQAGAASSGFHDRGILRAANSSEHNISVRDTNGDTALRGHVVTITVASTATITRDGHPVRLGSLKAGDGVVATGRTTSPHQLIATTVQATSPPRPDAPAAFRPGTCIYYGPCTPTLPPATAGPSLTMTISNFTFSPPVAVVPVGTIVTVRNGDPVAHTFSGNHLDSGSIATGSSFAVEFTTPGTYRFFCSIHPFMNGILEVQ